MAVKKRILSGMRPSGKLHLGNYAGALENWIGLQDKYDNFFFVADWHALTTNPSAAFEDRYGDRLAQCRHQTGESHFHPVGDKAAC